MSLSTRRRDLSPSRSGGVGSSKLRMDRQPVVARITDPSLTIGKRKEIDNVMKKARASTNEYWDKKLLEAEEKDPNRWRHTGYKKMYIEGESSSESEHENFRYNRNRGSRSRSRNRKSPPVSPVRRRSPPSPVQRRRSPPSPVQQRRRSPDIRRPRSPADMRRRPRSPPEQQSLRRKSPRSPRSPVEILRRRTPPSPVLRRRSPPPQMKPQQRAPGGILPRSKRPPSPPPKRSPSNSSLSSCSDDSCSVCSPKHGAKQRIRSRSPTANVRVRHGPRSPPPKVAPGRPHPSVPQHAQPTSSKSRTMMATATSASRMRPASPQSQNIRIEEKQAKLPPIKHRIEEKVMYASDKLQRSGDRIASSRHLIDDHQQHQESSSSSSIKHGSRLARQQQQQQRSDIPEDPRLKPRPPEPIEPAPIPQQQQQPAKKQKEKTMSIDKLRAKVKIEGEKRKKANDTSDSDDSSSSENSLPTITATTRLTLSERFGKMAQWSVDRSNMENMNMRITKDSAGGAVKVMLNVQSMESPPRRHSYSPAPAGHFPEELATTAPTGSTASWDDVRVRYEYYKSRGYLRDLDLKDYVKWEEWWYRYQEWLKQERYYEFYERQQMHRRRRKKIPITQRLN